MVSAFSNMCAIILAFETIELKECPGRDICSFDCQGSVFMDLNNFLFAAGAMFVDFVLFCFGFMVLNMSFIM